MGMGAAVTAPAWQAIVPDLVAREALQQAVATNSVGINISRAIGPALAGYIITAIGLAAPFLVNALSYALVVAALIWWRPPPHAERRLPPEDLLGAMVAGVRYAWHSRALKDTLARAAGFFLFASAYWAMLPLIARKVLGGGAALYGLLLASVGIGAVLGALVLPWLRRAPRTGPGRRARHRGYGDRTAGFRGNSQACRSKRGKLARRGVVDRGADRAERVRASQPAELGASAGIVDLRDRVLRLDECRQRGVGAGGEPSGHSGRLVRRERRRTACRSGHLALQTA